MSKLGRFLFILIACTALILVNLQSVWANPASQALVAQGRQALFNGGSMTVTGVLTSRGTFAEAVALDATDQEAQAFYGVTNGLAFMFEDGSTGAIDNLKELFEAFGASRTANDGIDLPLFSDLPMHNDQYDPPADLPGGEEVRAFAEGPLLARLDQVLTALETVQTGFAITITADENGGEAMSVDYADIQILRAYCYAARAGALIISAYDLSCDLNDVVQLFNADVLQFQRDLLDRYSTLLQLRESGDDQLLAAGTAFQNAVDDYREAHLFIVDRLENSADWRTDHLFSYNSLSEANASAFRVSQLGEIQASLNEDRAAQLTTIEQTWTLIDDATTHEIVVDLQIDADGNIDNGNWHGMNGCDFVGCSGTVQKFDIEGADVTIVLSAEDLCRTEATFTGLLSGNSITSGTYTGTNCPGGIPGSISGSFTGSKIAEDASSEVIDVNQIFGTGATPQPLDIRAVLPGFNAYNEPVSGTFPGNPILNGILPGPEPQVISNEDATWALELMPQGSFAIPTAGITIDGTFGDWDEGAKVFDDIAQDDPDRLYIGYSDLKSFWMAQDNDYYYFRTVYHDGAAAPDQFVAIDFVAHQNPEEDVWPEPSCYVVFDPAGTWSVGAGSGTYTSHSNPGWVATGTDGEDACIEWRVPKADMGDLSGRFVEVRTTYGADENRTFMQFPGYSVSGTAEVPGYTDGKILVLLYDEQDAQTRSLLASQILDAPGAFTLENLPNMGSTNCYLYVVWDRDGNGIVSFDDLYGATAFYINNDVVVPTGSELVADQLIDFTVDGSVKNVHQPDDSYATLVEVEIRRLSRTAYSPTTSTTLCSRDPAGCWRP